MKKQEVIKFGIDLGLSRNVVDLIIMKITDFSKNQLFLNGEIEKKYVSEIKKAFKKVSSGFPIEYFLENATFYSLDFFVDERVLIPRNDTEIMVERNTSPLAPILKGEGNNILIDVGTGSSCIAISIIKNIEENIKCFALDISEKALEVAKINIKKYNLENKITLIRSDLLEYFLDKENILDNSNLVITANLPYIKDGDFGNMDKETVKYEPNLALYGGEKTGFEMYEKLIHQIFKIKNIYETKKIVLFIEIGFDQKNVASKFLEKNNLKYKIFEDNGGVDRCIEIDLL